MLASAFLAGVAVGACGAANRIPPDAQQVRVTGTATEVLLDPPVVRAGDVVLVIKGRALFMQHAAGWEGDQPGPMSDEQLTRLAQNGDQALTSAVELYPGYAGDAYVYTLAPGKYAFFPVAEGNDPGATVGERAELCMQDAEACAALPPLSMAVLEVLP